MIPSAFESPKLRFPCKKNAEILGESGGKGGRADTKGHEEKVSKGDGSSGNR